MTSVIRVSRAMVFSVDRDSHRSETVQLQLQPGRRVQRDEHPLRRPPPGSIWNGVSPTEKDAYRSAKSTDIDVHRPRNPGSDTARA